MGKVLTYCFDMFEELWDHRNKVEHGNTPEEKLQIRSERADRAIIRLWGICQDLPAADRNHLCNPSREVLLTKRLSDKELWVQTTKRYLNRNLSPISSTSSNHSAKGELDGKELDPFHMAALHILHILHVIY